MSQRIFVDANIFYSKTLLDWLFFLRESNDGMFQIHSTEDVFAEVIRTMRKDSPRAPGFYTRRRLELIRLAVDEVVSDYADNVNFSGKDVDDYHVHSAAVATRADIVLTMNDPTDITRTPDAEPYEVYDADDFFQLVIQSSPRCLGPIVAKQLEYWKQKPEHCQLDEALQRAGCPQFASAVLKELQMVALNGGG